MLRSLTLHKYLTRDWSVSKLFPKKILKIYEPKFSFLKKGSWDRLNDRPFPGPSFPNVKNFFQFSVETSNFFLEIILKLTKTLPIDEMQIFAVFILGLSLEDLTRTNLC